MEYGLYTDLLQEQNRPTERSPAIADGASVEEVADGVVSVICATRILAPQNTGR